MPLIQVEINKKKKHDEKYQKKNSWMIVLLILHHFPGHLSNLATLKNLGKNIFLLPNSFLCPRKKLI
jgi:hypothetical protein